jgi:hypothetical protein
MEEFHVMEYANGCGIGIDLNSKTSISEDDVGFVICFETDEKRDKFPFKEKSYKGVPVFKVVIGEIVAG